MLDIDGWISFVVFKFYAGDESVYYSKVFCGKGPSQNLRELRHTYWGENGAGYIFFPSAKLICDAFDKLKNGLTASNIRVSGPGNKITDIEVRVPLRLLNC